MSMYAQFIKEYSNDEIIESEYGWVQYRYLDNQQVYIVNIWVDPDWRMQGEAIRLADDVAAKAKSSGYKQLLGTVYLKAKNSKRSRDILEAYGMNAISAQNDVITYMKEI